MLLASVRVVCSGTIPHIHGAWQDTSSRIRERTTWAASVGSRVACGAIMGVGVEDGGISMVAVIVGVGVRDGRGVIVAVGRETTVAVGMTGRVDVIIDESLEPHPARKKARIITRWFKELVLIFLPFTPRYYLSWRHQI